MIILRLLTDLIELSLLSICDHSWIFCLFICVSLSFFYRYTVPLRRPSASLDFLHSLTPPDYTFRISLCSVQDTTPNGVLSQCGCCLTLTLITSIGIWQGAGATKSWYSLVSLSCSSRISLCIRSNSDSGGCAIRIIHFSVFPRLKGGSYEINDCLCVCL